MHPDDLHAIHRRDGWCARIFAQGDETPAQIDRRALLAYVEILHVKRHSTLAAITVGSPRYGSGPEYRGDDGLYRALRHDYDELRRLRRERVHLSCLLHRELLALLAAMLLVGGALGAAGARLAG